MHEEHDIEKKLKGHAAEISRTLGGAPVVIVVGGDARCGIDQTMTASHIENDGRTPRLRDLLGILQAAIQLESWKHFRRSLRNPNREG